MPPCPVGRVRAKPPARLLLVIGPSRAVIGRYFTATELVETLYQAIADDWAGKVITQIVRADLIPIDENGSAPPHSPQAKLFLRLLAAAY